VRQLLPEQLNELALVTKDTLIYDCDDHWFYVFIGIAEIGGSFELSLRHRKTQEASPPAWPLAPCARLANAVGYGMHLVPGTTVKIDGLPEDFSGVMVLPDFEFGRLEPIALWQLVLVTQVELATEGPQKLALAAMLQSSRKRLLGDPPSL